MTLSLFLSQSTSYLGREEAKASTAWHKEAEDAHQVELLRPEQSVGMEPKSTSTWSWWGGVGAIMAVGVAAATLGAPHH